MNFYKIELSLNLKGRATEFMTPKINRIKNSNELAVN